MVTESLTRTVTTLVAALVTCAASKVNREIRLPVVLSWK